MKATDVVIVGGGVIGLSIAYELSQQGLTTTVLDRGPLGRAASWAGAGILAPPAGRATGRPEEALRSLSARLFPRWSEALRAETGLDNGYRACGAVDIALTEAESAELETRVALWRGEEVPHERLDAKALKGLEPGLVDSIVNAYLVPGRAQIRNPRHLKALEFACSLRGTVLRPGVAVEGIETVGDTITAVRTVEGTLPCDRVVLAAGAWSGDLASRMGLEIMTPPIKGQMVLLRCARPMLRRIIEHGPYYLVPRDDGRLLVGATQEDVGFDTRATAGAVAQLTVMAQRLCPGLAEAEFERCWAGLRPGNRDNRPTIGLVPGYRNLVVATGHLRSGLQLSTGTAVVVADLLLGRTPPFDPTPFRPGRDPSKPATGAFLS